MRKGLLVVACLLLAPLTVQAQQLYEVRDIATVPLRYYVGDPVVLRLRVAVSPAAEDRVLRAPEQLPGTPLIEITQIVVTESRDREYEVSITFTSFVPGTSRLPSVDLGGIVLEDVRIDTRSILEDRQVSAPEPPRGPLVLPGTWRRITLAVVLLLLAPLLGLWSIRAVRDLAMRISDLRRRRLPINRLMRALKRLRRKAVENAAQSSNEDDLMAARRGASWGRRFYIDLTAAVREYLGRRLDLPVYTATTAELGRLLQASDTPATPSATLLSVLARSDLVKFGDALLDPGEIEVALDRVENVALMYEEAFGAQS